MVYMYASDYDFSIEQDSIQAKPITLILKYFLENIIKCPNI